MTIMTIKTSSWFTPLPEGHFRIGISRGSPRNAGAGFRLFKTLAPGPWFNSVGPEEYYHLYRTEILAPLNPRVIAATLLDMARGAIPVMLCYEPPGAAGQWCHRAMAAEWLSQALGQPVPEVGFESRDQRDHPNMPEVLRNRTDPLI